MHREQQRPITASVAEEVKRREEIKRKRLEDALTSMDKKSNRTEDEIAELHARLDRLQQTIDLDDTPTLTRVGDR